jgi:Uma2 family endonuclease
MSVAEAAAPTPAFVPSDPENRDRYEIIDGRFVEMPPMSADSTGVAAEIGYHLNVFGRANGVGKAYTDMLVKLPHVVGRNRRPDVMFVPFSKWPADRPLPPDNAWDVLPDLCVEVVSPTDMAEEITDKLVEYFRAGVRLVWVVYPRHQHVYVYESLTALRGLTRADTLDGGPVLPGFLLPLAELFPEPPAQL